MPDDDDDERYGELIPPSRRTVSRIYDGSRALDQDVSMLRPGWGFANLVANLRHRSAARLMDAKTTNVEALTRYIRALDVLDVARIDRERGRRRLENLDEILDAEKVHEDELTMYERKIAIAEARKRLREVERGNETSESKERSRKPDPAERIRQGHAMRQRLREECEAMVNEIRAAAKNAGTENSPDIQREVENIMADFAKVIADTYEKG